MSLSALQHSPTEDVMFTEFAPLSGHWRAEMAGLSCTAWLGVARRCWQLKPSEIWASLSNVSREEFSGYGLEPLISQNYWWSCKISVQGLIQTIVGLLREIWMKPRTDSECCFLNNIHALCSSWMTCGVNMTLGILMFVVGPWWPQETSLWWTELQATRPRCG